MVKTRFAPSPTGFLHIGGVRTALYNWLYARQNNGQFILRVEDTDQSRSTQASIDVILQGLNWLGLNYDQGPFYQMERLDRYHNIAEQLVKEGKAYYCDCHKSRLEKLREEQIALKQKPRYDGHCRERNIDPKGSVVVRFKTPKSGAITFSDQVYGQITINNSELDDLVLLRSDGIPTYNFSVVIDDWDMAITHVIRGDDHLNNTPRQIHLWEALGVATPEFVHLPMILGKDGKRLSKRYGALNVLAYKDEGYLPEALLNYLARLGWSHGDQEIFSIEDLLKYFSLKRVHRGSASYDTDKLTWLNEHYLRAQDPETTRRLLVDYDPTYAAIPLKAIDLLKTRVHTLKDYLEKGRYFISAPTDYNAAAIDQFIDEKSHGHLAAVRSLLANCEWDAETISEVLKSYAKSAGLKFPSLAQPLRIAVSGDIQTPSINAVLSILDRDIVLERMDQFLAFII